MNPDVPQQQYSPSNVDPPASYNPQQPYNSQQQQMVAPYYHPQVYNNNLTGGNMMAQDPRLETAKTQIADLRNDGIVYGEIISYEPLPAPHDVCWYCTEREPVQNLYRPCNCAHFIHRECFRKWRTGWINPKNYFACPECMYNYTIERVRPESDQTRETIIRNFRLNIAKLWLGTLILFGIVIAAIAVLAYYADNSNKNIPVGVKYMLSSVASGWPDSNSTQLWRENFKKPDVYVWPYYTVLGVLCASVCVIIAFCAVGCTFDESERKQSTCDSLCTNCCNTTSTFTTYGVGGAVYAGPPETEAERRRREDEARRQQDATVDTAFCCTTVGCQNCCQGCSWGCSSHTDSTETNSDGCFDTDCNCSMDDCKLDGDGAIFIVVLIIIVVIAVILSAIVIVVLFAIHKWALFYQQMNKMLANQQQELEGETVVLGINEKWKPNAV